MSTKTELKRVLGSAKEIHFDENSKFIIMSDCHRGDGGWNDNFYNNRNNFIAALTYYYDRGYSYIEAGDGDELWENRGYEKILSTHNDVFHLLSRFNKEGRFYMLYGNHDIVKKNSSFKRKCNKYYCENSDTYVDLFIDNSITEGLILLNPFNDKKILIVHGHQGEFLNDKLWRIGRFLVRYIWRPLELLGFNDPTSTAVNMKKKTRLESIFRSWVDENKVILIAGHTHRPAFPLPGDLAYFNGGSCVHPRHITAIEIESFNISLVKWSVSTKPDRTLYIGREVVAGPINLNEYYKNL